jgi:hypothetical protein
MDVPLINKSFTKEKALACVSTMRQLMHACTRINLTVINQLTTGAAGFTLKSTDTPNLQIDDK